MIDVAGVSVHLSAQTTVPGGIISSEAMADPIDLTPQELHALLQRESILLIDVREVDEYANRHIQGALLLPMSVYDPEDVPRLPVDKIVLVCGIGKRSTAAAKMLLNAGFDRPVYNLAGGVSAWANAKLPLIEPPSEEYSI